MKRLPGVATTRPVMWLLVAAMLLIGAAGACGGGIGEAPPLPTTTPPDLPSVIEPPRKASLSVTVQGVVDVRTVKLSDGVEVRVSGLAAPDECWAEAANTFARAMLLDKPVESTPEGSLRLGDGTDYALLAVELGMVRAEATEDRALREAEASASAKRLGRWGPVCVTPSTAPPPPAPVRPPTPAQPPAPKPVTGCSVAYRITHSWPGGFRTDVTIRNTGNTAVNGWTLRWTFANGQTVSEMWNATPKQTGPDVLATAMPYNQTISAGESLLAGFNGTSGRANAVPRAFSLNGLACAVA